MPPFESHEMPGLPVHHNRELKRAILRQVYEDNLGLCDRSGAPAAGDATVSADRQDGAPRKAPAWRRATLWLALWLSIAGLVGLSQHGEAPQTAPIEPTVPVKPTPAVLAEGQDSAAETLFAELANTASEPGDYGPLVDDPPVTLAGLFGLDVKTIAIDPGHGGKDAGAVGPGGLREKDVTLDIARRLRERLERHRRFRILMTREDDAKLTLRQRIELANSNGVDLFVSIHVNYLPVEPPTVIETYYFGPHADERTLQLAERENRDSDYALGDFKPMIQRISDTFRHQESKSLALAIQRSLYRNLKRHNEKIIDVGIKTAPFMVLLGAEMPSVLAEVTCISNRQEEKRLATPEYREDIARYLEEGIVAYLEKNQNNPPDREWIEGGKHYARQTRN